MKIYWNCPIPKCTHPRETTSHLVPCVPHLHGGKEYKLIPFKKERKKTSSLRKLKADVWDLFSEWVRRSEANAQGFVQCVTCKKYLHWKDAQAGHYIHGTGFRIPELVHSQCPQCNGFKSGNLIAYKEYMLERYGADMLARFEFLATRTYIYTQLELQYIKKDYQQKLIQLGR